MNYLEIINDINAILEINKEFDTVRLINNAKIKGGTGGEVLAIVCSLLKVYEIKFPTTFFLIRDNAILLFNLSKQLNMKIIPNYNLLDELDWK